MYKNQSKYFSIEELEDQLGGTLFLRSNKGMDLTEEGKMFYEYVKGALELINNAENEFTSFKDLSKFFTTSLFLLISI